MRWIDPHKFQQHDQRPISGNLCIADSPVSAEVPIGVMEVPVRVWGSRPVVSTSSQPGRIDLFAEETCTVIVFPHGAVIRLSAPVAPGQMMMVTNRKSLKVVPCRVVNVRNYPNVRGYAEIEFLQSVNGFWGPYTPQGTLNLRHESRRQHRRNYRSPALMPRGHHRPRLGF